MRVGCNLERASRRVANSEYLRRTSRSYGIGQHLITVYCTKISTHACLDGIHDILSTVLTAFASIHDQDWKFRVLVKYLFDAAVITTLLSPGSRCSRASCTIFIVTRSIACIAIVLLGVVACLCIVFGVVTCGGGGAGARVAMLYEFPIIVSVLILQLYRLPHLGGYAAIEDEEEEVRGKRTRAWGAGVCCRGGC